MHASHVCLNIVGLPLALDCTHCSPRILQRDAAIPRDLLSMFLCLSTTLHRLQASGQLEVPSTVIRESVCAGLCTVRHKRDGARQKSKRNYL